MNTIRRDAPAEAATGSDSADAQRTESDERAEQSVVALIPAYNEADSIADVIREARAYADDVIVVDDASDDDTEAIAREHADGVVVHPTNLGVGAALHTGYRVAIRGGYDRLVQLDADGQHDPSRIPEMLALLEDGDADVVVGSRWLNPSYREFSLVRRLGIRFFTTEANLLGGTDLTDVTSGYRAYDVSLLEDLGRPDNSHWALEQTLEIARNDGTIAEISVPMPPRADGSQFDLQTFALYPLRMFVTTLKVVLFR